MSDPFAHKTKEQVLDMWQSRALRAAKGRLGRVLLQCFKKEYIGVTATSWETLLRWIFPGFDGRLKYPILMGHARVELSGRVTTGAMDATGRLVRMVIYQNKDQFVSDMRRLADQLKLDDAERVAMFDTLKRWIPEDRTINVYGEKIAS